MNQHGTEHDQREDTKPLRVETWLFLAGIFFFVPIGLVYGFVTGWSEPVGAVALILLGGMFAMSGGYLWLTGRRVDKRPEDDPLANIEDRAGEVGVFSPHSWWPLVMGAGVALAFLGITIGWWMTGIGAVVALLAVAGQFYEFSRGQHAH